MPSCPDCGLMFGSLHHVQSHRRSGTCSTHSLADPVSASFAQPTPYDAGHVMTPVTGLSGYVSNMCVGGYGHGKGGFCMQGTPVPPAAAPKVPCMTPTERELEQLLAIQSNQQKAEMVDRERMLLEQQVNLVLPARQAHLQQSQEALKDQLLQMKLHLFASQHQQQYSNNMDMEYLRNEMAAMRGALSSMSMNGTANSDPGVTRRKSRNALQRKTSSAHTKNVRKKRQHSHYIDEDDSWENIGDTLCSDECDDDDDRGETVHRNPRGRSPSPQSARLLSPTPSQKIHGVLKSMQAEIRSLRSMGANRTEPALFPTSSVLKPGLHLLKLGALEEVGFPVPLNEVDVSIKVYYMSHAHNEYLLDPSIERSYPRHPSPLVRHDANTTLFTVAPLEFIVHSPKEMVVFVLHVIYRSRLLCWATIFAKSTGSFSEGIRNSRYDLAKALQTPGGMVPEAKVTGYIEADSLDILQHAELMLNPNTRSLSAVPDSVLPQKQHVQLPGLPPLPPPPLGLPLLPGMPGCEGPFLPPKLSNNMMLLQPTKGPVTHFILPPPTGMSILEWNEVLVKHLKRLQKPTLNKAAAPGAEKADANGNHRGSENPTSLLQHHSAPRFENVCMDAPAAVTPIAQVPVSVAPVAETPIAQVPVSVAPVAETPIAQVPVSVAPAAGVPVAMAPVAGEPVERPTAMPIQRPRDSVKVCAVPKVMRSPPSSNPPSFTMPTQPPPVNNPLPKLADNQATNEQPRGGPRTPMANHLPPPIPSAVSQPAAPEAAAPPPVSFKVPQEDMPLVERNRLRILTDPNGNLAVPPDYKVSTSNLPCVGFDRLYATADPPVNPCVLFGLSKPTDTPPAQFPTPGHGENGNTVDVFVDGVSGLPLDTVCSRVLVYITDQLDLAARAPINPLHHPRVFMRKPDLIAYQNLTSSSIKPTFEGNISTNICDNTHAVVIVEYITGRQKPPIVFGHCCLPINKRFFAGNFVTRLKLGDPRRSDERAVDDMRSPERIADEQARAAEKYNQSKLETSIDAQALHNLMPLPPSKLSECTPLGYLIWRLDSANKGSPFFEMPQQVPLSQQELQLFQGRSNHENATPNSKGLMSEKEADDAFIGSGVVKTDSISYIAPFSEQRGAFVKVEGIRGVGDDTAMYIVVVYMMKAPKGRRVYYTRMPDFASDVGTPMFKDPPFLFPDITYDKRNTTMYMLLKLSRLENVDTPPLVECIGWTMNKVFMDDGPWLRQGRFVLSWLDGPLPQPVVKELLTEPIGKVFISHMQAKSIAYREPKATLTVSQGDPACCVWLVDNTPGRAQASQLLMPAAMKPLFPSFTCEGMVGCTLRKAHEKCFGGGDVRALLQRMDMAVQGYLAANIKELEEL
ncbi:hypothetical protein, conserved [Leishmania tarentolae]|uniref:C2H2-type domain-containing protein n=1 Tax=Leishmania tarentolae TaxID=5689 RepID=A0A640KJK9_LEITA|nr:hypothetical protein, conserved [Leishmania tarentolae]